MSFFNNGIAPTSFVLADLVDDAAAQQARGSRGESNSLSSYTKNLVNMRGVDAASNHRLFDATASSTLVGCCFCFVYLV